MKARVVLVAAAAAYGALVATTTPFTAGAEAVTAVGLAAGALACGFRLARRRPLVVERAPVAPAAPGGSALPWVVLLTAVVAFEFYCYLGGPRPQHPTLSTLYDLVVRWRVAKAALVVAWVGLGWELVR